MTSRERVLKTINFQEPDRVPIDLGGSRMTGIMGHTYSKLREHLGIGGQPARIFDVFQMLAEVEEPVRQRLGSDVVGVERLEPAFGIVPERWKPWRHFDGSEFLMPGDFNPEPDGEGGYYLRHGGRPDAARVGHMPKDGFYFDNTYPTQASPELSLPSIREYTSGLRRISDEELAAVGRRAKTLRETTDYAVMGAFLEGGSGSVGTFADWMMILAGEREYARDILHASTENALENLKLYCQAVGDHIDIIEVSGHDFGTQKGPTFSPSMFADLYAPCLKRLNDWVHQNTNLKTWYHCCGSIYALLPTFIEMGVDIINPVQTSATDMDPGRLKREFGTKIVFWGGGVDTQSTLPFGTPDEVAEQVRDRLRIFAPGGGFVFTTVHNIQHGVPAENLVAMFQAAREHGSYPIA